MSTERGRVVNGVEPVRLARMAMNTEEVEMATRIMRQPRRAVLLGAWAAVSAQSAPMSATNSD